MTDVARVLLNAGTASGSVVEDHETEDETDADVVLIVDKDDIDTIGIVVAEVIITNMNNLKEVEEYEPEKIAFIADEIETAIGDAFASCDFSTDAFEQWKHINMDIH